MTEATIFIRNISSKPIIDILSSEKMLKMATSIDPNFFEAYIELADAYNSHFNRRSNTQEERYRLLQMQQAYLDTALHLN